MQFNLWRVSKYCRGCAQQSAVFGSLQIDSNVINQSGFAQVTGCKND